MELIVYIIPADPDFVPEGKAQSAAKKYLRGWRTRTYAEYMPTFNSSDHQRYYGGFPDRLNCPHCKTEFSSWEGWGGDFRHRVETSLDARNELFTMPCCETQFKADQFGIDRNFDGRFSRFAMCLREAPGTFSEREMAKISQHLKCEIIQFTEGWT